ncbi:MAG: CoA-binding protein [Bacillota bacterium]
MYPVLLNKIEEFLEQKRIAIVGISRDEKDYTRNLFTAMKEAGYEMIPVNPFTEQIEGLRSYKSVTEIDPAPEAVLVFTVKTPLDALIEECIRAGIKHIWIHNHTKDNELKDRIFDLCRKDGRNIIIDYCPFMFLPESSFPHKLHGFCLKIAGKYPSKRKKTV